MCHWSSPSPFLLCPRWHFVLQAIGHWSESTESAVVGFFEVCCSKHLHTLRGTTLSPARKTQRFGSSSKLVLICLLFQWGSAAPVVYVSPICSQKVHTFACFTICNNEIPLFFGLTHRWGFPKNCHIQREYIMLHHVISISSHISPSTGLTH